MYSKQYMKHFTLPQNSGEIEDPDAVCEADHKGGGCFDRIKLTMKVEDGKIADLKYKLRACSGTIAASSAMTMVAIGKEIADAEKIGVEAVIAELDGVPDKKMHSVELAVEVLHSTIARYKELN